MYQPDGRVTTERGALWPAHDLHALHVEDVGHQHERLRHRDAADDQLRGCLQRELPKAPALIPRIVNAGWAFENIFQVAPGVSALVYCMS